MWKDVTQLSGLHCARHTVLTGKAKVKAKPFVLHKWILGLIAGGYETIVQNSMNNSRYTFVCSKKPRGKSSWIAFVIFHEAHLTLTGDNTEIKLKEVSMYSNYYWGWVLSIKIQNYLDYPWFQSWCDPALFFEVKA